MAQSLERPRLSFFCELDREALQNLFADPDLIPTLVALDACVALGILDLSEERADVVRRLNAAGIPVVAWQLLPEEAGYWYNVDNAPQAVARYADFLDWTATHDLRWDTIGIDIEPDMGKVGRLAEGDWRILGEGLGDLFDSGRIWRARALYGDLVARMHRDGYAVEAYHFPVVVDERRAGSALLERLAGLIHLEVDREVLMLYSSFLRPWGAGVLWSYGPEAASIAVGSTGGGVTVGGADQVPALSWEELARDLRLARRWTTDLYVFSLEGCVRQGYLERLVGFDWSEKVVPPVQEARKVTWARRGVRVALWTSAHLGLVVAMLILAGGLWWLARRRKREG